MITRDERLALIAAANRAPSVHNIQPTQFRFDDEKTISLVENAVRRLHIGDPSGKDVQKSMGAALEGLVLALSERGIATNLSTKEKGGVRVSLMTGADPDPLAPLVASRVSYRGAFAPPSSSDPTVLAKLAERCPDLHIIGHADTIADIARFYDRVSLEVVRDAAYRAELLSWMRLSRKGKNYWRDGLNAEHMSLTPFEAYAAGIVLGPGFPALNALGVAGPLMAEASKVRSAMYVALFHRPALESELETGRRFYRVWLEIERLGLALCPMSVLADVPHAATRLMGEAGLGPDRKLVTAFRIGRRPKTARITPRARLPAAELLLP